LLLDWLAMRASMAARHLPLCLPEQPPDVEAFWTALHAADGPLPDLGASFELLEADAAGAVYRFAFPSRVVSPDVSNNTVHGRYYAPANAPLPLANVPPVVLTLAARGPASTEAGAVDPAPADWKVGGTPPAPASTEVGAVDPAPADWKVGGTPPAPASTEAGAVDPAPASWKTGGTPPARFMLLLHVNGCRDRWFEVQQARRLMGRGWHVALMALPYHLERRPARLDVGAAVMTPDLPHTLAAVGQAVCDAADILRWARAAGAGRVVVAGWSLGGLVASLVATQVPLDAALLVEPAANLAWMMARYGLFPRKIRRQLRAAGLSQAALERWLAPILPVHLRPKVEPGGLRVLAARYDLLVGREPVEALWRAWGQPALQMEPTGHVALLFDSALARALDELALAHLLAARGLRP
jgi:pimeloyl-ACP methyl ester carboxylesterase